MDESVEPVLLGDEEAARLRGELAIDAADIGTFDWDLVTGRLEWDDRLIAMFGYDPEDFDRSIEGFNARVHPDDLARVTQALQTAIDTCGDVRTLYRVRLPSGDTRWISARGRTLCDPDGRASRLLGAAYDVTSQHEADASVTRVLEAMPAAFFALDRQWRFTYVNAHAERLLQPVSGNLVGQNIWEAFPAAVGSPFEVDYRHAMASGETVTFEAYYPPPLDSWYEVLAWPNPDGLAVYFLDVTVRRAEQERAARASARLELLASVTEQVTGTLHAEQAVARLAQLVVPSLADWCVVTLVDDAMPSGSRAGIRDVGWWHADDTARPLVEAYCQVRIPALRDDSFLLRTLSTGEQVIVDRDATTAVRAVLHQGEAHQLIGRLAPESLVVLPLRGRGRTVGLLSLFNGPARGHISVEELATAGEVASRAGMALDNARLYRQQRLVAGELQRSLLTAPPEPDHAEVVVRYLPAAEAAAVGGDWYDAFLQRDGATVLVIGDVAGHDIAAAAAMGQLRGVLRGIATSNQIGPAEVLTRLDESIELLDMGTLVTAAVARIEQDMDQRLRGVTQMRWSNAGHPPPLILQPDGSVLELSAQRAELMLGIEPAARRTESVVTVDRGATVLLYTDGLIERRDSDLDAGLDRLKRALTELADLPLQELCDQLLERLVHGRPDDDVALVAVRLHRQDRPRPAEAGPKQLPAPIPDEPSVP
ncbi:Serine phosphatase RsbU, regulator of sigma subunit [Blastococcus sp. DSM 46786]|uniref:SpoIIE family protein phosphatase n=1 Tax=Blastococcus sp. DSM 46786 TaxID=1798227 RepID=UPI0008CF83A9|nr:SpoIIE family protein phosphatase [Blastococcus sp. DSM 46786]SEL08147.1 Serine phosphatase RsbU, regulator of sigma subunit [Blastococcus sp. DSM 46786]